MVEAESWGIAADWQGTEAERVARIQRVLEAILRRLQADGQREIPLDYRHMAHQFFGYRFDFRRHGLSVSELTMSYRLKAGTPLVVGVTENGEHTKLFLSAAASWAFKPMLDALVALCAGDEFELDYTLASSQPLFPGSTLRFPDGWWTQWKDNLTDEAGRVMVALYREGVYPWAAALLKQVPEGQVSTAPVVWDLCGGDGEGLGVFLEAFGGAVGQVHLFERNDAAVNAARTRFGSSVGVHQVDVTADDWSDGLAPRPEVILASGALNVNVLDAPAAETLARVLFQRLQPGGIMIVTGGTPSLLNRAIFEDIGFRVFNTTRPSAPDKWSAQQLYGLQKPR